ncbi:MAG: S8 family serine peptidase [Saprospiraceae bacterium]|nr:S8 family serine peptidase [Saprospiraceae bacterium]
MKFKAFCLFFSLFSASMVFAQDSAPKNWFNLDLTQDGYPGLSTEKTYKELLKGKTGKTVVVAVIDSGVDYMHEDLKDIMWVNPGEIAGNGVDDDKNGYVDDIHGWNFLGNKNGENIAHENLEVTRLYVRYKKKYEGKDPAKLSKAERIEYDTYVEYGKVIEKKLKELAPNAQLYEMMNDAFSKFEKAIGKDRKAVTLKDVENFKSSDPMMMRVAGAVKESIQGGESFADLMDQIEEGYDYFYNQVNYNYNTEYDARHIIGDDPQNVNDRNYGNSDVKGSDASHGTHVSGIIAAIRGNGIGMDGVADNVRIMAVRAVPNGDERDKDVANAIRYAVDNGATVINMSFGKGASPEKSAVDAAVRYAMERDVLLVHGAGNDGSQISLKDNFPNDHFAKSGLFGKKMAENWIEVGAHAPTKDEHLAAEFSNYSPELVDVFAPGVEIYSTVPNNGYKNQQGTSMASPMVAGVAALLRSYYPDLTAKQVKDIIMESASPWDAKVIKPGTEDEKVNMSQLSVTGGLVNVYEAVKMANNTKGKKKASGKTGSAGMGGKNNKKTPAPKA